MWLVDQLYTKTELKGWKISKVIIHNNDFTPENESESVHKIDPELKSGLILQTFWSYIFDKANN